MKATDVIKMSIDMGKMISMMYLEDMTDKELLVRPCAGCNHINWQVGHLIVSENSLIEKQVPGAMPPLPEGFAEKYAMDKATVDDPQALCTKAELLENFEKQRAGTLAALAKQSDTDLDKPSNMEFAPTLGSIFELQGGHWLMHAGQWAVVRRQLGRKPLF